MFFFFFLPRLSVKGDVAENRTIRIGQNDFEQHSSSLTMTCGVSMQPHVSDHEWTRTAFVLRDVFITWADNLHESFLSLLCISIGAVQRVTRVAIESSYNALHM